MGKFDNVYPRGVVLDWENSDTVFHLHNMPEQAKKNAVYWLNKDGIVYKTLMDALLNLNKFPVDLIRESGYNLLKKMVKFDKSEKAYYHRSRLKNAEERSDRSYIYRHLYLVTTIDVPYAIPLSTKPGNPSTVWISKSGRAYRTRNLAVKDNIVDSIPLENYTAAVSSATSFLKSSRIWIVLCIVGIVLYALFKNKKYGKQIASAGSREVVPALPE
jgi:hypothetical protein